MNNNFRFVYQTLCCHRQEVFTMAYSAGVLSMANEQVTSKNVSETIRSAQGRERMNQQLKAAAQPI
jgi:hypothetical protein